MKAMFVAFLGIGLAATAWGGEGPNFKGKDESMKDHSAKNLAKASFEEANCFNTKFIGSRLAGASFKNAECESANFKDADCNGVDFRGARLKYAQFLRTKLQKANFEGVDLKNMFWLDCDLREANLKKTKGHRDMNRADLRGAKLHGADFFNAKNLETAKLQGAEYDDDTAWPSNFDPKEAGAVLVKKK